MPSVLGVATTAEIPSNQTNIPITLPPVGSAVTFTVGVPTMATGKPLLESTRVREPSEPNATLITWP